MPDIVLFLTSPPSLDQDGEALYTHDKGLPFFYLSCGEKDQLQHGKTDPQ
ncbi:MAG: hypothetical protein JETT_1286 [Candidatus Jettenia ecosi]|uniref:Uncharacterized protein n=1 Tax=Candidatus Jettenia ecosi TaxID=2494326 RepID=A0A533QCF5_9BACT|nr:MAG: hypothetical protein JETT_1286 [Candidatus Jettenia ecosi]